MLSKCRPKQNSTCTTCTQLSFEHLNHWMESCTLARCRLRVMTQVAIACVILWLASSGVHTSAQLAVPDAWHDTASGTREHAHHVVDLQQQQQQQQQSGPLVVPNVPTVTIVFPPNNYTVLGLTGCLHVEAEHFNASSRDSICVAVDGYETWCEHGWQRHFVTEFKQYGRYALVVACGGRGSTGVVSLIAAHRLAFRVTGWLLQPHVPGTHS